MSSYDATFKILLLNEPEVDKSSLFPRYETSFQPDDQKTIRVEILAKTLVIEKKRYKLQFWDFMGGDRFRFLLPTYCLGANAAIIAYDVSRSQTLDNIGEWVNIVRQKSRDIPIMLVGIIPDDKSERQVSAEEGMEIAASRNLNGFIECGVRQRENVKKVFEALTRLILPDQDYSKGYFESKSKKSLGRESYSKDKIENEEFRERIRNLVIKLEKYKDRSSRIIAAAVFKEDTLLYATDNWDIKTDISRGISNRDWLTIKSIVISGVRYIILHCTPEILVATSIRGGDQILVARDKDYRLILHAEPNGDDGFMGEGFPYIFTHPKPPDDFEPAAQVQIRAPLKEKEPEEEVNCQFCGMELTKEEQLTHSCKKKPKNK